MLPFDLRESVEADLPFLWEMLYQSIYIPDGVEAPNRDELLSYPPIQKYLKGWGQSGDYALIATDGEGMQLGAIWIRQFDEANAGWGFVDAQTPEIGMAILPGFRGKGIGRRLLQAMCREAHTFGYPALSLSVDPRNIAAMRLYETSGFFKVAQDPGGSWTMVKGFADRRR